MDHALLMGELDREADVDEPREQRAPGPGRVIASREHVGERDAGESLHREERRGLVLAEIVDGDHARMLEPALHARLAQEARDRIWIRTGGAAAAQELDRELAIDARVVREPYLAHTAAPEQAAQCVARIRRTWGRGARSAGTCGRGRCVRHGRRVRIVGHSTDDTAGRLRTRG